MDARVQTLVLTYEATDYTQAEWNYCQSKPLFDATKPGSKCYSNDSKSYLTSGPRGATAGHGREIQAIVWLAAEQSRETVANAFGSETDNVDRLITLSPAATEKMLCAIWMDPARRTAWKKSFERLGATPVYRGVYDQYYRSSLSDGAKVQTFYRLYERAGLTPSEVDYGFFVDRATHSTPPKTDELDRLAREMKAFTAGKDAPNAFARLYLTRTLVAGNVTQRADRMGRDMAFLLDALAGSGALTTQERVAWSNRGRFLASDVGLSESRQVTSFAPITIDLSKMPRPTSDVLLPEERDACPKAVLLPLPPHKKKS